MDKKLYVSVEALPKAPVPEGTFLNSPSHEKGSFVFGWQKPFELGDFNYLLSNRLIWKYSTEDLEEFDMFEAQAGWRINAIGLKYVLQKGYEVYINQIQLIDDKTISIEQNIINLIDKQNKDYKIAQEIEKQKREEAINQAKKIEDEYNEKRQKMIGNLVRSCIQIYRNEIEVIPDTSIQLRHKIGGMCADRIDYCQQVKIPKLNCNGVEEYLDIYDMESYIYYIPTEINEPFHQKQITEKIQNPRFELVINTEPLKTKLKEMGITQYIYPDDELLLKNVDIQKQIIDNFKIKYQYVPTLTDEIKQRITDTSNFEYYSIKPIRNIERIVFDYLGMTNEIEKQIEIYNNQLKIIFDEKVKLANIEKEKKIKENAEKIKQYTEKKAKLQTELESMTKNQIVEKYQTQFAFKPSWGKAKVIEEIIRRTNY